MTRKRRKGGPSVTKEDPRVRPRPEPKGQVWDCHLLTAGMSDGTPFDIMPILDARSKECLATLVEPSIGAQDVTDCLFNLFVLRGVPDCIRSNNGTGSMAKAIDDWLRQSGVETHSVKGKPRNNGAGSYSRKLKDELIDRRTFATLPEAKAAIEGWRELHNKTLIHPATPTEEPCQPSQPQHLIRDDSADLQTRRSNHPAGQIELQEIPGLAGSDRRGAKDRQSVPSADSRADETDDGGQSIPQGDFLASEDEPYKAPGLPGSIRRGADDGQSAQSQVPLDVIVAGQSVQPQGSVPGLAKAHRPGRPSQVVSAKVGSEAQSLKPSFFSRYPVRTAIGEVKKTLARSMGWVLVAVPILLVTLVSLILVAPYFGWRVDTVRSGSTGPGLKVGSLVVTRPVQVGDISVGDVITFRSPTSGETTSRRVSAIEDGPSFRTEGIANGDAEAFVTPAQSVIGRVWFHVPFAGYLILYLMTPICVLMLFVFGLAIVVSGMASILQLRRRPPD